MSCSSAVKTELYLVATGETPIDDGTRLTVNCGGRIQLKASLLSPASARDHGIGQATCEAPSHNASILESDVNTARVGQRSSRSENA